MTNYQKRKANYSLHLISSKKVKNSNQVMAKDNEDVYHGTKIRNEKSMALGKQRSKIKYELAFTESTGARLKRRINNQVSKPIGDFIQQSCCTTDVRSCATSANEFTEEDNILPISLCTTTVQALISPSLASCDFG